MSFKKIILVLCLTVMMLTSLNARKIKFKGKKKFDRKSGTYFLKHENNEIMAITNQKYHFGLILPYFNDWSIEVETEKYLLMASHGDLRATIEILKITTDEEFDFIDEYEATLLENKDKLAIEETKIINYKDEKVLVTLVDVYTIIGDDKVKGIKQVNYYASEVKDNHIYKLHMSVLLMEDDVDLDNLDFMNYMTVGFSADF